MRDPDSLTKFNGAINAFYDSRLIIVDKVISGFLSTVVDTPDLIELVSDCAKTSNFRLEFNNAVTVDKNGNPLFRLPHNPRHTVALVVGLLFEFDKKSMSMVEFVTKFYPAESSHDSYLAFLDNVMTPFADAFLKLLVGDRSIETIADNATDRSVPKVLNEKAREDCDYWVRMLMDAVIAANGVSDELREDSITMIKGMLYALDTGNPIIIKLVWIGMRNTLNIGNIGNRELNEIEAILVSYFIIDR